jgi:dynein heavy chain
MNGGEIPKQRGIYSEILTTEDSKNLKAVSTIGPHQTNIVKTNEKQKIPRAKGIRNKQQQSVQMANLISDQHVIGKNYFRDPDVNEGFYSRKRPGVADVDPKVMEPFVPIPGKPPRKVVIDRQRKLFASLDIEELLLELGIDYKNPQENQSDWLPLEPFDDTEYDCRLPSEWIEYGYDEDGNFNPIPGKGLYKNPDNSGEWLDVLINTYDPERGVYIGIWDQTKQYCELTRINLLFNSEYPRIFAQRVA